MDNKDFIELTTQIYEKVFSAFEGVDPDEAEADMHLDHVVIEFSDGTKFIVNRQPPVHQLWLATKTRGFHFNYDEEKQAWISDKEGHEEFFDVLEKHVSKHLGRTFSFSKK